MADRSATRRDQRDASPHDAVTKSRAKEKAAAIQPVREWDRHKLRQSPAREKDDREKRGREEKAVKPARDKREADRRERDRSRTDRRGREKNDKSGQCFVNGFVLILVLMRLLL